MGRRLLLAQLVASGLCAGPLRAASPTRLLDVKVEPVDLYPLDPTRRTVGRLTFEAGFALSAPGHFLGGLSGLLIDGDRLYAVSDGGTLWRATLDLAPDGRLRGIGGWQAQPLRWPAGSPHIGQRLDAESLAWAANGSLLISLEEVQAMLRWDPTGARAPVLKPYPAAIRAAPPNQGVEALVGLPDGRLLAITEGLELENGTLRAAVFGADGAGETVLLAYRPGPSFKPTAADRRGDLLFVLERRASLLSGFEARILWLGLRPGMLAPDAILEGEELARLGGETTCDNMEGLTVTAMPDGRICLYLVSDDNFSALERTLLLQFSLPA